MKPVSGALLGMGMSAGLVTYIYAFNIYVHYGPLFWRVIFGAGGITGVVSIIIWARQLQTRCDLLERALREHGITPPEVP
jgi:hypothetical protein